MNARNENQIDALPGEDRGMPSVNDVGPSTAKRGLIVILLLLFMAAAAGIGYWKYKKNLAKQQDATVQKNMQLTSAVPARTFVEPPTPPAPASAPPLPGTAGAAPAQVVPAPNGAAPALPGNAANGGAIGVNGKPLPTLDKASSGLMAGHPKSGGQENTEAAKGEFKGDVGQQAETGAMASLLSSTRTAARKAGMIGNRNFILAKGSFIDCGLQTRLDSTIPGMTACVITRDIFSDNGKVLLLEKGSTVTGEYRSNLKQGMARIYVLWSRIKTPNGVVINLDSPGTDPLGGAGVPGYMDTHFWERFGGAIMLSMVDDVARAVTSNTGSSSGNNQFNFSSTGDASQNMAAEALKNTINIPPTLYKNQGEQVGIYVARDLDFSSVYDVATK